MRLRNLGPKGRPVSGRPFRKERIGVNPEDIPAGPMTRLAKIANRNAVRHTASTRRLMAVLEERDAEIRNAEHTGGDGTAGPAPTDAVEGTG